MIQIWDSIKGEWVDKFSAPENEIDNIVKSLEEGGLRVIVVGTGRLSKKASSLENSVIQALLES